MNIRAILHALAWALASSAALADAQVYSPLPVQLGTGPQQASSGALALFPGDNHGSMGRTHVVFKVNNAIWFYNRQASQFTTPAPIADASFWPPAPGATSFTPKGDGRVIYDPYEPAACPGGGGRWILAEMGVMNYSSSTCAAFGFTTSCSQAGVYMAVSQGENPTGALWFHWNQAGPISTSACVGGAGNCYVDFPQIGFNTNWIALTADFFGFFKETLVEVFPRQAAECSGDFSQWTVFYHPQLTAHASICPAETYYTNGQNLNGSTLYLLDVVDRSQGTIGISKVTGTPTSASVSVEASQPAEGSSLAWTTPFAMQQATGPLISSGPPDDRFTGCVVRNNNIWAAQTIGLLSNLQQSNFIQWWQIGATSANFGAIQTFERLGPGRIGANTIDPSIAVNKDSDVLIGFEEAARGGTLNAAYAYRDHVTGGNLELPFIYKYGQAPYTAGPGGGSSRTGDYGHSNPDPGDDTTFFTTAGFAGSQFTGTQNYGWQSGWALVKPPPIRFVGYQDAETEIIKCPAAPGFFGVYNCTVTLTPPSGTQPGDVLAVTLDALLPYSEPAVPAAWTTLPAINQANAVSITSTQGGYLPEREWLLVHQYGNSELPAYSFSVNVTLGSDSQGHYFGGQLGAFLVSYRGASGNFADYVANGYPSSAVSSTVSLGPIAPVANRQLVALFRGGSDDPSGGSPFSGPWGYPPLTGQTPRALPVNVINMLGADLWTANFVGFDYGAYTSPVSPGPGQTSAAGTVMGWLLFMPPK